MRRVVEGQPDGHDEDHARDDLDGEAAEVRVADHIYDGEGDAKDHDERHANVDDEDERDCADDDEGQDHVADELANDELQ